MERAIVLCEKYFGTSTGKTANGLVRYSKKYKIVGVIDSTKAGKDAGEVLDGRRANIEIFANLSYALEKLPKKPEWLIIGVATVGGYLPQEFRSTITEAIKEGINIASGLHEYLCEDGEFSKLAEEMGVQLLDIRKSPPLKKLHQFGDRARNLQALKIPVLGTDGAIGKRTTAILLNEALNRQGIKSVFVATGQTGLLQGASYGLSLDAIKADFMVGELENEIVRAYEKEKPKVILIEGQGSISHPAFVCGTRAVIMASCPDGIILQHAPRRKIRNYRTDILAIPMPSLEEEIEMLEIFSKSKVIALAINHEDMMLEEVDSITKDLEKRYGIPACDPLVHGCSKLVDRIEEML